MGVAGFHHMSLREIADNTGLRPRDAELARSREFDEPFFFTSADEQAIARFVETARARGFDTRRGSTFWHLSSRCDTARAVRTVAKLFRDAAHLKLQLIGTGSGEQDVPWLGAMDHAILLPGARGSGNAAAPQTQPPGRFGTIVTGSAPGSAGWNRAILDIIGQS